MNSTILIASIASLVGTQAIASENEDWSDIAQTTDVGFVSENGRFNIVLSEAIGPGGLNIACDQPGPNDGQDLYRVGSNNNPSRCETNVAPPADLALSGRIEDQVVFYARNRQEMIDAFGEEFVSRAVGPVQTPEGLEYIIPAGAVADLQINLTGASLSQIGGSNFALFSRSELVIPVSEVARYSSVEALAAQLATNRGDVADNRSDIDANSNRISENENAIATNRTDIDQNRSDIDANSAGIQTNATAITTNSTRISTNSAAIGVNSAQIARNMQDIDMLQQSMVGLDTRVTGLENQVGENRTGIAIAMAMSGGVGLQPGETFRMNANWGTWDGDSAFAVSATYRASRRFMINAAAGSGSDGGEFGGRAGVSFGW